MLTDLAFRALTWRAGLTIRLDGLHEPPRNQAAFRAAPNLIPIRRGVIRFSPAVAEAAPLSETDEAAVATELADNDFAPWLDPSLPLSERMEMAEGKPLALRMMAAMAQQNCGRCGYDCAGYANALFLKEESGLTLCEAGGKETMRVLKQLVTEVGASAAAPAIVAAPTGAVRKNPGEAKFVSRRRLNGADPLKTTWHIEFDISAGGLDYVVGDSFGVIRRIIQNWSSK